MSSRASFTVSTAAMLPVTARTIVLPLSFCDLAAWMLFAGCMSQEDRRRHIRVPASRGPRCPLDGAAPPRDGRGIPHPRPCRGPRRASHIPEDTLKGVSQFAELG